MPRVRRHLPPRRNGCRSHFMNDPGLDEIRVCDPGRQYANLAGEINSAVHGVLAGGHYIMGPNVRAFEQEIAAYLGIPNAIALNSGTDAIHLALRALGIGPGDEVITTAFSFAATSEAIGIVGANPVFVDIAPGTFNLWPEAVVSAISPRTRAILPVHLFGQPADMAPILEAANANGIAIVEDCAQSMGATWRERFTGTLGTVGCYSFFPTKNLGAAGDGGLCVTQDNELADKLRMLRSHGWRKKYYQEILGINSRLDEIQAAILRVKLPHLTKWNARREKIAAAYDHALTGHPRIKLPERRADSFCVFHQYTIRIKERDQVQEFMRRSRIDTQVYYPFPLHRLPIHADLGHGDGTFPEAERTCQEVLSLPMFPELADGEVERICQTLIAAVDKT